MKSTIIGVTVDPELITQLTFGSEERKKELYSEMVNDVNGFMKEQIALFSGRNAGICYMADSFFSESVSSPEKALKRFSNTIKSTHHSIGQHCHITVLFEEVPKIFAMIMNSFQVYNTSEKSARYTEMSNLSDEESELYHKWIDILEKVLIEKGAGDNAHKLAMENARYFISVFSPATTFSYTTSMVQWNYIYIWFKNLIEELDEPSINITMDRFRSNLKPWLEEFIEWFEGSLIYNELITDPKSRRIEFIPQLYKDWESPKFTNTNIGDIYEISYYVSFSCLAQLQRHRSLQYVINNMKIDNYLFFCPDFIDGDLAEQWMTDIISISGEFPQGMCVQVTEFGTIEKYMLKCDERLCGRAQYETMCNVTDVMKQFYLNRNNMSQYCKELVSEWVYTDVENPTEDDLRIKAKCEMRETGCADKGGCIHGPIHANDRLF